MRYIGILTGFYRLSKAVHVFRILYPRPYRSYGTYEKTHPKP